MAHARHSHWWFFRFSRGCAKQRFLDTFPFSCRWNWDWFVNRTVWWPAGSSFAGYWPVWIYKCTESRMFLHSYAASLMPKKNGLYHCDWLQIDEIRIGPVYIKFSNLVTYVRISHFLHINSISSLLEIPFSLSPTFCQRSLASLPLPIIATNDQYIFNYTPFI